MTNFKTKKISGSREEVMNVYNGTDLSEVENGLSNAVENRFWVEDTDNRCLAGKFNKAQNSNADDTEDADEFVNDGNTSTSFSLQECMNEFRARRILRTSSSQFRQDRGDNKKNATYQETTELDLINQNLCNKEQERKCKPCQNGFCYCFTSDSGEGGPNLGGSHSARNSRNIPGRNARRSRRLNCSQLSCTGKGNPKKSRSKQKAKESISQFRKTPENKETASSVIGRNVSRNDLTAISSLETSPRDAPLIHIIQELRENCIISRVRVNKYKMQLNNIISEEKHTDTIKQKRDQVNSNKNNTGQPKSFHRCVPGEHIPTAPTFEKLSKMDSPQTMANLNSSPFVKVKKSSECCEKRYNAGGQLLHKRLSNSKFSNKHSNINVPPPKPPRSSLVYDDKYCGSSNSTSSSVREAEQVVDDFLKKKGFNVPTAGATNKRNKSTAKLGNTSNTKMVERVKRKSYPLTKNNTKPQVEDILSTYPSLNDIERVVELKKSAIYGKNIRPAAENASKVISIGWNETKINDMLNYDVNIRNREFQSGATQAQPQQRPRCDVVGNENPIGGQIQSKLNLDTVDSIVRHNLASNLEDKSTPVKSKLISSSKKPKNASQTQKFIWSEQLRHLSPWSNKATINDTNNDKKSNLRSSSKAFIKSSKKKFLRLVSPKKENTDGSSFIICKTPNRTVGVQTQCDDVPRCSNPNIHEHSSNPQSPPGSYHSPIQSHVQSSLSTQSQNTTPNGTEPALTHFDFSRTVQSPPKRGYRSSQRKLNFPLNCTLVCEEDPLPNSDICANEKKTYHSFNSELDQDVSLSKISYILSNIREKLEASDQQAVRTFLETECIGDHRSLGFDCPDGHRSKYFGEHFEIHENVETSKYREDDFNDPIYSEIEDASIHTSESQNFDSHTGIQHFIATDNPEILYAKVNKCNKQIFGTNKIMLKKPSPQIPLAKIMQDSLKSKKIISNITPLPSLPEPPGSESGSYSSPTSLAIPLKLNNANAMEHNLIPKKLRNLSKSDLSIHRSEIFLENLCRSDLVVDAGVEGENLEKVQNDNQRTENRSYVSITRPSLNDDFRRSSDCDQDLPYNDNVSYELPNADDNDVTSINKSSDGDNFSTAGSNLGLSSIVPPSSHNQSTPKKKKSFMTKGRSNVGEMNVDTEPTNASDNLYNSWPNTPSKTNDVFIDNVLHTSHSFSMNEVSKYETAKKSNTKAFNTLVQYKNLKNALQKSFRKSKTFIRVEAKRLSPFLNLSTTTASICPTLARGIQSSNLNIEELFSLNESASISDQIAQTVSICRNLPDLEISTEMVEAERLLLFSALRRENQLTSPSRNQSMSRKPKMRFFIDDMFLPVVSDVNQDIFFNYYYIVTFECGGVIKSTQSAECVNGTAVFRECGIEFLLCSDLETDTLRECSNKQNAIKCNIFMLRLRKISTISIEQKKRTIFDTLTQSPSSTTSASSNEIVSRFRLYASFVLNAIDFVPYEYVHQESNTSERICVRASCFCTIPLTPRNKSSNLSGQLRLKGRAEVRFPKRSFEGFLNVEDPHAQHNWNRRWCTLDGIFLYVWQDENCLNKSPLLVFDLRDTEREGNCPLVTSPRELCARPRSFCLVCTIRKEYEDLSTATVFFSAESQDKLDDWLKNLNILLDFIATWL